MEVSGVRLYHDQALYKESGGGVTPWHADQYYWPLSSDRTVTAWIPLQAIPREMGPLAFSPGSHRMTFGRDFEIGDESERKLGEVLKENPVSDEPFDLGEVSFHSGWVFHRAGANASGRPREVMTIIYMDENMRLAEPRNKAQRNDHESFCKGAGVGEIVDTPTNPVLWSRDA
jgi:ectoine hydroxylase-related dioxygenase (phytanoyl-CoA dioxygenase family)